MTTKSKVTTKVTDTLEHPYVQYISNENLNLCRQSLTDKDIPDLIEFLSHYPEVKTLNLSLNNIGDQGIADFAERNHTITVVDFSGNNIGDRGLAFFAYKNQMVTQVNFSQNLISEEGITNFIQLNHICYNTQFSKIQLH